MKPALTIWHDSPESALSAAKAAAKRLKSEYQGWDFPEGRGFAVWYGGYIVERHLVRRV